MHSDYGRILTALALSFLVGGSFVNFALFLMERYRNFGPFVGGLPSTGAFSFFFIGWAVSSTTAVDATTDFPVFMSLTGAFLLFYAYLATKATFSVALVGSLAIWFLASFSVAFSGFHDFLVSIVVWVIISTRTYFSFRRLNLGKPTWPQRLLRFILGGGIVVLAVVASQFGGAYGGAFSAAPAVFTSTIIALKLSADTDSTRNVTMPLMVSGMITVVPYGIAVRYLYPIVGIGYGTLIAYLMTAIIGAVYFQFVKQKLVA